MKQVALMLVLVTAIWSAVNCQPYYKVNENYQLPLDLGRVCGDNLFFAYNHLCNGVNARRKRAIRRGFKNQLRRAAANRFLSRTKRNEPGMTFNIQEECCYENCRTEEVLEYCYL